MAQSNCRILGKSAHAPRSAREEELCAREIDDYGSADMFMCHPLSSSVQASLISEIESESERLREREREK